jgi:hypothetical protein
MWPSAYPPRAPRTFRRRWRVASVFGMGCGLLTGLITAELTAVTPATAICGVLAAVVPSWQPSRKQRRHTPKLPLRQSRRNIGAAAVQFGLLSGIVFSGASWLVNPGPRAWITGRHRDGRVRRHRGSRHQRLGLEYLPCNLRPSRADRPAAVAALAHPGRRPPPGVQRQAGLVYQFRHTLRRTTSPAPSTYDAAAPGPPQATGAPLSTSSTCWPAH